VDGQPDPADQSGAVGDDEPAAAVAVPAVGVRGSGLVVPAAVEQGSGLWRKKATTENAARIIGNA